MSNEERLQKIISSAGITSRRKAEELIKEGRVRVNGQVVGIGAKADPGQDHIKIDGRRIPKRGPRQYLLLNKPRNVISTVADPQGRTKVTDLVKNREGLYPVGRLDYQSEGLILLTNDGSFARVVTALGRLVPKTYQVKVKSVVDVESLSKLRSGMRLREGVSLSRCKVRFLRGDKNAWYEVTLTEGKNQQIRRMFEQVGHPVIRLRRVSIGFLTIGSLPVGRCRDLTRLEVARFLRLDAAAQGARGGKRSGVASKSSSKRKPGRARGGRSRYEGGGSGARESVTV